MKLKDLLQFPCDFTYKVIGDSKPALIKLILEITQRHAPGSYKPIVKSSAKGNYYAVSIKITATSIKQIETLYAELAAIDIVRMVL
ncbi:DUF493 family protein YbeD [Candidatus Photodesmus blepharus]|uniref:DUF493 family protein YbeD n=1 Tax=Candidatus Photodesmus blepharonis TaxID=1179155 RepID=UPI000550BF86|nr:DUF493 family protein YbeD [Candidatus Photodesmus blepharus]